MTCWAIIPVKPSAEGKTRLAAVLDEASRTALVSAMLEKVVEAAQAADRVQQVCILGPSRHGLPEALPLIDDNGEGLNPALTEAFAIAAQQGVSRVVFLAGDLPQISAQDVQLLAVTPADTIAIAPDRHGLGTNALSLPLPAAAGFRFAFGEDSFALHHEEAERLGLEIEVIHSRGLARDIDEPTDLPDAAGLG